MEQTGFGEELNRVLLALANYFDNMNKRREALGEPPLGFKLETFKIPNKEVQDLLHHLMTQIGKSLPTSIPPQIADRMQRKPSIDEKKENKGFPITNAEIRWFKKISPEELYKGILNLENEEKT